MVVQSSLGLAFPAQYRDDEWIRATWHSNDWVTLTVAVPLLLIGRARAGRGAGWGLLLWLGVTGYAAYNYGFYLFGAALNAFFLLYVAALVVAAAILIVALPAVDAGAAAARFRPMISPRLLGGYFVLVALALTSAWVSMWAAYVFAGRPTPVEPDAFRLVAALDLSVMVPLLALGGSLLWRQGAWGVVTCAIAGVQASIYLLVLSANAVVAIERGLAAAPGELPVWGPLFVVTLIATVALFSGVVDSTTAGRPADG